GWGPAYAPSAYPVKAPPIAPEVEGWTFEGGGRAWMATKRFQKDLPAGPNDQILISRLTYENMDARTGEVFGRIDSPWRVFVKGNVGVGKIRTGKMTDEDWGIGDAFGFVSPYSNTIQEVRDGDISYFTGDIGFNIWRGPDAKVGPFVGFNYLYDRMPTYGCTQIAAP